MNSKPQLVLDLAGVLVSNFSSSFWRRLSQSNDISFQDLREQFDTIRKDLWTGKIREDQFWTWLSNRIDRINIEEARGMLIESLEPLPAMDYLASWSRIADIHILSNHCKEWLESTLSRIEPFVKSITISNQVGLRKPELEIYKLVERNIENYELNQWILYIDDQEKNFKPVINLGWKTLLADNDHKWTEVVEPIILSNSL
ncbi:HAD family hydrolase [Paenibacillus roseipurpureus]|uniref:Haloacid dehalogenase n=1 Tax=Paenibacillus roseopurpureus TaxID=2918901 RepID=A0AA96RLZ2_9BACL|nr:haloacid dehalogenase [Paenibacillus sp. MBLB1832]WNR43672.1 haloacid dehalogenase [Paenibacillus sp. MBLB1832]